MTAVHSLESLQGWFGPLFPGLLGVHLLQLALDA